MVSFNLEDIVSWPKYPVAYCVVALNKLRRDCSRFEERFSDVMVDARLRQSRSLR